MLEMSQSRAENYLNNIIRIIPANIYWKDENCTILGGNLAHAQDAGFTDPKEVIGKTDHDFVWKEQAERIMENDRIIMKSGVGCQLEEAAILSDGKLHTFLTCKDPLRDKDNNVIGIIGMSTDITDFKELQKELLQTKAPFIKEETTEPPSNTPIIVEEEMRKTVMILAASLSTNYAKKINSILYRFSKKSSLIKTIVSLKKRIQMLEMSQSRAENYLNNIIRIIPANIYWKDVNCTILGGNLAHAQDAGFTDPKEVIGKTEHDFVWKEQADRIMENDRLIMKSGVGCQLEEAATLADGKLHTFLTCKDPLRDKDNNVIGIIGMSTDITDFKELQEELVQAKTLAAEAAAHASNAKALTEEEMRKTIMIMVGDIVHNLRTPITTIKTIADLLEKMFPSFIDIVQETQVSGPQKTLALNKKSLDYLMSKTPITDIQNAVQMMNDFINTTLNELANAHQSLSSALTKEQLTKHSSHRIIENTIKAYPFTDSERNKIKLELNHDFEFMGNSILSMKLLFNLIKNALEQIALNGQGDITLSTQQEKHYNVIRIKDTAGGAPPEIVSHLFNGYFTTKEHGTGIGLAFCKKTMLSFGGDISCHSVHGESMEFILKFPVWHSHSSCHLEQAER